MALPLTRRIARTALLLAAGAAPAIGVAGTAAAADLPAAPDLGGVTNLDGASTLVGDTTGTLGQTAPGADKLLGGLPVSQANGATGAVGQSLPTDGVAGASADALPTDALGSALPTSGLNLPGLG
ncbi:ATP-binding protein [Streptomyces sp. BI20]|uniref:ATP-binding protein n=1 Tax=Streptomyces sp. BI20 TaxID=3403460 RepID=UPI003C75FCCE